MTHYFHISAGLRGAYTDGAESAFIVACDTLAELREAIAGEAESWRDAGYVGASKRNVAIVARDAWDARDKGFQLPYALPLAPSHDRGNYAFGVFVANATALEMDEMNDDYPDDEAELSARFDSEVAPHVFAQYGENDEPAMSQAFNDWSDMLCKDGEIGDAQYNAYCYVGRYAD